MASFFNVGALGANPFSTPVGQRIEQATDAGLGSENWALNMEICDMINESSDTARDAMKAIRKRLTQSAGKNNQIIMYTLTVLETCVKNCGKAFHVLVAQKDFIQELVKLIGPKNDPPAAMQEKVLSLIQIWADAFKNQPDLSGVNQLYNELKNKGIEFPQPDIEHMAPIYTPQRSVPEAQVQTVDDKTLSPHRTSSPVAHNNGTSAISPEQLVKLQSEMEIVSHSMSILSEMLSELKPGQEDPEDYGLLTELTATCKEMQGRIVELIGRVSDDELTAEFLRLNDELNNLFLRHQRYEKNRSSHQATSPSAVLGAAMGVPLADSTTTNTSPIGAIGGISTVDAGVRLNSSKSQDSTLLIDLRERTDKLQSALNKFDIKPKDGADEFDMLAQSRTDGGPNKSDALKDIPTVHAAAGSVDSPFKRAGELPLVSKHTAKDNEVDEMEAWLGSTTEIEGVEETITSTEFDKFLEERAAAAENLPTITGDNNASTSFLSAETNAELKKEKKKMLEENLLAL